MDAQIQKNSLLRVSVETKDKDGNWSQPNYVYFTPEQIGEIGRLGLPLLTGILAAKAVSNLLR